VRDAFLDKRISRNEGKFVWNNFFPGKRKMGMGRGIRHVNYVHMHAHHL